MIDRGWSKGNMCSGSVVRIDGHPHSVFGIGSAVPRTGTLAMAVDLRGDGFWQYAVINEDGSLGERFCGYRVGELVGRATIERVRVEMIDRVKVERPDP